MGRSESNWLQQAIVEDLKRGSKTNAELCAKYQLNTPQLRNVMDTIGYTYPVYNPVPGHWAILGAKND